VRWRIRRIGIELYNVCTEFTTELGVAVNPSDVSPNPARISPDIYSVSFILYKENIRILTMELLGKTVLSGVLAYSMHYGALKAYSHFCIPDGTLGFIRGFLTTGSPICQTMMSVVTQTQTSYSSFVLIGLSRACVDIFMQDKPKST